MGKDAVSCPEWVGINYPFQASIAVNFCTKSLMQDKVFKNVILSLSDCDNSNSCRVELYS